MNKIEDVGKLRNLKPGTIRTYKNNVRGFLKFINKHPEDLTCEGAGDLLPVLFS
ncbi:phage integrase N-terminal SAM-like domain-containing protein [Waltera intestinalis]|nr:phage integrase N-terminal SAM-like domain-containing protein [Waltera intestinalis]